ncbi:helix-turn-helix transcriptional regulator [Streptosporangium saharense]|uniref:helix-turn-helix transcriptional regulator n=1 Tax=Streptosporangium saharense TaxID=1706840 RepID=UPI0036BF084B
MVDQARIIAPEIAAKYGRAVTTVTNTWRRHPEWPEPVGRRGRWVEYNATEVDEVVRRLFVREELPAEGRPDDLLTIAEIVEYTGLKRSTIDADISRGRILPPDEVKHGVKRWRRSTIDSVMKGRRGYRRAEAPEAP